MLKTLWATVRQGKIELLELSELPEGAKVLVTLLPDEEAEFWLQASNINSGSIGINITHSQDTAVPCPYN